MTVVYSIITKEQRLHLVSQESSCFSTEKGESKPSIPAFPGDTALFRPFTIIRSGHRSQCPLRFTYELYSSTYTSGAVFYFWLLMHGVRPSSWRHRVSY